MAKYSFVSVLYGIEVDQSLGRGDQILPGLYISNDQNQAERILTPLFRIAAGGIESRSLVDADAFVYTVGEWPSNLCSEEEQKRVLKNYLGTIQLFLSPLWLIKDCSVNQQIGFLQFPLGEAQGSVSSNFRNVQFSRSEGSSGRCLFTRKELRTARKMFTRLWNPEELDPFVSREDNGGFYGDVDRVSRCLFFLQAARGSNYLPAKIAFYCTCFESVVSTDASELTHKVAERVGALLRQENDPTKVFKDLKAAYAVRSKAVHGSPIKTSKKKCAELSGLCDEYLRKLLRKALGDMDLMKVLRAKPEQLDDFFLNRIMVS